MHKRVLYIGLDVDDTEGSQITFPFHGYCICEETGEWIKTNRKDAEKLVRLYRKDRPTPVDVPTKEDEADRGLIRSREFLRERPHSFQRHLISLKLV